MKKYLRTALISLFLTFSTTVVFAQAEYVLPYPSFMPGHPLYKASSLVDKLQEWWSFGSLAKFKYHLDMADKKLVEAKTLFEYKQYLLAVNAIEAYEYHLRRANNFLGEARIEGKDISQKKAIFKSAIAKHREILERLKEENPKEFFWKPEKEKPQTIEIENILNGAIELGKECEEG